MICIVNYGIGNTASVFHMLSRITHNVIVTDRVQDIEKCAKIVLPGVGSFDAIMERIVSLGLYEPIRKSILEYETPTLGICAGMQILAEASAEVEKLGLAVFEGVCKRISSSNRRAIVPNIGWSTINYSRKLSDDEFKPKGPFYFSHSYTFSETDNTPIWGDFDYMGENLIASLKRGNLWGVQFHPEKSNKQGFDLLTSFVQL